MKRCLCLVFCITIVLTCCITQVRGEEIEKPQLLNLEEIIKNIQSTKEKLLRDPRGISIKYMLSAFEDPTHDFGLKGNLTVINVIKWPELYIDATGVNVEDSSRFHRTSVYNFVDHTTIALDQSHHTAILYPARFLFSSAHSDYYKYLHYAEGYQFYRLGEPFTQVPTVPECFFSGDYQVVGVEEIDGEKCVHIQRKGYDDIWLSLLHGFYVHKRVVTYGPDQPRKFETLVLSYQLIDKKNNLWVPMNIQRKFYFGLDNEASKHDQVRLGLEINVTDVSVGDIDDSIFTLEIPDGYHVSDLLADEKYYYKNRPFDEVVAKPSWMTSALILVNILVVLLVISLFLYQKNKSSP
ncbi:hypothetical protein Enr17x_00440 [Gimesia fumaroli]|uniref:Uncharacterized protein n=1 Tax=Gimesia fumaroli TaxID=2527976 RepID=A0A518I4Q1_9PLAN|nr:hypothetical protein Enr17x_00440 [Gimesia fumaroli]